MVQMVANYQHMEDGGRGYLRLVRCDPAKRTVSVETYSPYRNSYLTDLNNQLLFTDVDLGGGA